VGAQASYGGPWPELAESHLNEISEVVRSLKEAAAAGTFQCVAGRDSPSTNKGDASMVPSPVIASATDTYPWSACYPLFGRLRRDTSVEHLAGKCQGWSAGVCGSLRDRGLAGLWLNPIVSTWPRDV
jgi:hypothetical protein